MAKSRKKVAKKNIGGRPAVPDIHRMDKTLDMVRFSQSQIEDIRARYAKETAGRDILFSQWVREKLGV